MASQSGGQTRERQRRALAIAGGGGVEDIGLI